MREEVKKEGIEWIKAVGIGLILVVFIRAFFFSNYVVEGESMRPTLEDGNKLIVNKLGYQIGDFNRFDVIVFHANEEKDYVKRIIGLPGDEIEYKNDQLFINGKKVNEPYLNKYRKKHLAIRLTEDFTLTVPKEKLFVLGDNRLKSYDSRQFGFISVDQVVGKVNLRYWPIDHMDMSF
ncbi:signal peptidase I [Robertmurraya sp. Marseille-Q9965]